MNRLYVANPDGGSTYHALLIRRLSPEVLTFNSDETFISFDSEDTCVASMLPFSLKNSLQTPKLL